MQNPKLNNIVKKLNDPNETKFFVNVRNSANNFLIEPIAGGTLRAHGSIEKYLHTLAAKGIKEVILEPRHRNGSSSIKAGDPVILKLQGAATAPQPVQQTPATPQFHHATTAEQQLPGLGGVGLGQYMEAHASMRALQKLEQDHAELKMKYDALFSEKERIKDENIELKRTNDRLEDKIERKGPLDGLDINQALPALLELLKQAPAPGLNAPQQKQLSPVKDALRQSIEQDTMPDEIVGKLYQVLHYYTSNNVKAVNELEALFKQMDLKPVADA